VQITLENIVQICYAQHAVLLKIKEAHMKKAKRIGFTLAEVLITIAIVGVVAAMTIPNLIQKSKEKATVAKLRETYAILSQAYRHAVAEYGTPDGWKSPQCLGDGVCHSDLAKPMKQYMKLAADCVLKTKEYTEKYCSDKYSTANFYTSVKLINGTVLIFRSWNPECLFSYNSNKKTVCGEIMVDLEPDKTEKRGENFFDFYLTTEGVVPEQYCNKASTAHSSVVPAMSACAAWAIYKGNMDYLHCNDLSWTGKSSCH
jgi:prepilin-type N-terminal cleavage/methylation domain-containing protein